MDVASLLNAKGREVHTIEGGRSIAEAVRELRARQIGALVVTSHSTPLAGVLSERDIVRALSERGASILDEDVAALMTSTVTTCEPSTTVMALMALMTERRIRHIPVVEDGQLVGLVSIGDVVKTRLDELEREKRDLLEYVSAR